MNWGNKLLLVFAAFGSMMGYMVYNCMKTPVNLVAKEYYKDELAYQQVIDAKDKSAALNTRIQLTQLSDSIVLQLPAEMKNKVINGELLFYYAADARRDRTIPLQADAEAQQSLPANTFIPGSYTVKITWQADSVHYYAEQPFTIQ